MRESLILKALIVLVRGLIEMLVDWVREAEAGLMHSVDLADIFRAGVRGEARIRAGFIGGHVPVPEDRKDEFPPQTPQAREDWTLEWEFENNPKLLRDRIRDLEHHKARAQELIDALRRDAGIRGNTGEEIVATAVNRIVQYRKALEDIAARDLPWDRNAMIDRAADALIEVR